MNKLIKEKGTIGPLRIFQVNNSTMKLMGEAVTRESPEFHGATIIRTREKKSSSYGRRLVTARA